MKLKSRSMSAQGCNSAPKGLISVSVIMQSGTSKYDLSKVDSDKYWELVRRTLADIFSKNPNDAQPLENEVRNSSPDEQVLFYHSEPLSTAAGIAGRVPTQQDIDEYKRLRAGVYGLP